jgi:hypothetical protein
MNLVFAFLVLGCIGLYFGIEEYERRKANPGGETWTARLKRSFRSNRYFLIGSWVAFALYFFGLRKHDLKSCAIEALLMTGLFVFIVLHGATQSLSRKDK